jgi:hypothetical protein
MLQDSQRLYRQQRETCFSRQTGAKLMRRECPRDLVVGDESTPSQGSLISSHAHGEV